MVFLVLPLGGCADGRSATSEPAPTETTAEVSTSAVSTLPESTAPPSTTPPSTTSTTVAPTTTNRLGTVSFTGHGSELIDLGPGNDRFIVRAVHTGRGAFSISARNEAFETVAVPIFGRAGRLYFGSQVIGAEPSQIRYLDVIADGDWNVEMLTTSMLPTVTMPFDAGSSFLDSIGTPRAVQPDCGRSCRSVIPCRRSLRRCTSP